MEPKAIALNGLRSACRIFLQDLEALPEQSFSQLFGGAARTVADIVYEVNMVNDHVGLSIRGEPLFDWPEGEWIRAPEGLRSKADVVDSFKASSTRILETVEAYDDDDMMGLVQTEFGETNRFERCRFMTLHLWYHSGQLNFIQTLLGDDKRHWT